MGPSNRLVDLSMIRLLDHVERKCTLMAALDDYSPERAVPPDSTTSGGWTRLISVQTSSGDVVSRWYGAFAPSSGRKGKAPPIRFPDDWTAEWAPFASTTGQFLYAVEMKRLTVDASTQTETDEMTCNRSASKTKPKRNQPASDAHAPLLPRMKKIRVTYPDASQKSFILAEDDSGYVETQDPNQTVTNEQEAGVQKKTNPKTPKRKDRTTSSYSASSPFENKKPKTVVGNQKNIPNNGKDDGATIKKTEPKPRKQTTCTTSASDAADAVLPVVSDPADIINNSSSKSKTSKTNPLKKQTIQLLLTEPLSDKARARFIGITKTGKGSTSSSVSRPSPSAGSKGSGGGCGNQSWKISLANDQDPFKPSKPSKPSSDGSSKTTSHVNRFASTFDARCASTCRPKLFIRVYEVETAGAVNGKPQAHYYMCLPSTNRSFPLRCFDHLKNRLPLPFSQAYIETNMPRLQRLIRQNSANQQPVLARIYISTKALKFIYNHLEEKDKWIVNPDDNRMAIFCKDLADATFDRLYGRLAKL